MHAHQHAIVCYDPTGTLLPGALLTTEQAHKLRGDGLVALPVDAEAISHGGPVCGFFLRSWGAGWPLDGLTPTLRCPMMIQAFPELTELHWAAHIITVEPSITRDQWSGIFQLSQMAPAVGSALGIAGNTSVKKLPEEETLEGGWIVGGTANVTCSGDGLAQLALYGVAPGFAVRWAAVTVI